MKKIVYEKPQIKVVRFEVSESLLANTLMFGTGSPRPGTGQSRDAGTDDLTNPSSIWDEGW